MLATLHLLGLSNMFKTYNINNNYMYKCAIKISKSKKKNYFKLTKQQI